VGYPVPKLVKVYDRAVVVPMVRAIERGIRLPFG
jgi:hypothetical protein